MPSNGEIIEKLAKQLQLRKILELAAECKTLDELIEKLKAIIESER